MVDVSGLAGNFTAMLGRPAIITTVGGDSFEVEGVFRLRSDEEELFTASVVIHTAVLSCVAAEVEGVADGDAVTIEGEGDFLCGVQEVDGRGMSRIPLRAVV